MLTMLQAKRIVEGLLELAGIQINWNRPYDMVVHNEQLYGRIISQGSLGLGDAYIEGRRECDQLDEFFSKVLRTGAYENLKPNIRLLWEVFKASLLNMQNRSRARQNVEKHYDLDANFYMKFLDPYNQYTCWYFKDTTDLNTAQEQKLDLICKKLQLKQTDHVLDIGCGRGGFAKYAAQNYGCHVTGVSISKEQISYAKEYTKWLPVEILYSDYRDLQGTWDKILICGMIEHVGPKNYRTIMEVVHRLLTDAWLFLLHTIAGKESQRDIDPWINKYIFPGAVLPSASQISKAIEGLFTLEDWHNFGQYYDPTLMAWWENFKEHLWEIQKKYGETFVRIWKYYFLCCAGSFRCRRNQLYQVVLSKGGRAGGYQSIR